VSRKGELKEDWKSPPDTVYKKEKIHKALRLRNLWGSDEFSKKVVK